MRHVKYIGIAIVGGLLIDQADWLWLPTKFALALIGGLVMATMHNREDEADLK